MRRIISFGEYVFDQETQGQFSDNFTNGVTRHTRLPMLSGAFDELGFEPAPTEVGNIKRMFIVIANHRQDITQRRDAIRAMAGWGVRKLVMQPADQFLQPRYCYARIQNIQLPENAKTQDRVQQVNIDWQVSYPRWMQDPYPAGATWGSSIWGSSSSIWGDSSPLVSIGAAPAARTWGNPAAIWGSASSIWGQLAETTLVYTNNGNAISQPRLVFACTTAASGLVIERLVNGTVQDRVSYTGSLAAGQVLDINCRSLSVTAGGSDAYNTFSYVHPAWLRLLPGANTLRVTLPSGSGTLRVIYPHTWF